MKINEIIKEKRTTKGLTQEEIANYLGVSTPAVNKWEKGVSYPDITILPALARLLKVDLNTLLSFNDNLSDQEIGHFSNELANIMTTKSFDIAFKLGLDKIYEYPTCDKLILTTAIMLDGGLSMYGSNNKKYYKDEIEKLYIRITNSENLSIKNSAISMLVTKFLERKEFEKAQEYIDSLEDVTCDKKKLQGSLYLQSGEFNKASEVFEHKLLAATTELNSILLFMMEIAIKEKLDDDLEYFAKILEEHTKLYDLWEYNSHLASFQIYSTKKDVKNTLKTLDKMIDSMSKKWKLSESRLYKHIKKKDNEEMFDKNLIAVIIRNLKDDETGELAFLKGNEDFYNLLDKKLKNL